MEKMNVCTLVILLLASSCLITTDASGNALYLFIVEMSIGLLAGRQAVVPKLRILLSLLLLGSGRWGYVCYYWRPGLGHPWYQWKSLTNGVMRIGGKSGSDARSMPDVEISCVRNRFSSHLYFSGCQAFSSLAQMWSPVVTCIAICTRS